MKSKFLVVFKVGGAAPTPEQELTAKVTYPTLGVLLDVQNTWYHYGKTKTYDSWESQLPVSLLDGPRARVDRLLRKIYTF